MSVIEAKRNSATTIQVIALAVAAVIGVLFGWVIPDIMLGAEFIGKLFLGLLSLFVIPVILTTTISGIAGVGRFARLGAPLGRIALFFVALTAVGVVLGGLAGTLLAPGSAVDHSYAAMVVSPASLNATSVSGILSGIIGGHVLLMVSTESYLGLVLLALALGAVLSSMGNAGRTAMSFFRALNDALMRLVGYLMYAAPVGILFLVGGAVAHQTSTAVGPHWSTLLGGLCMAVAMALLVQGVIVMPLALFILNGRSPFKLLSGLGPALLVGLGLGSSAATLPVTYRCAVGSGQVEPRAAAVALPLGMVINRSGTAIYLMVAALFAAQMFGVTLGPLNLILLGLTALLLSLFGAATPMVTLISLPFIVSLFDIHPAQAAVAAGVIAAGDWLLVRMATVINVWGDAVGGAYLSEAPIAQTSARRSSERRPARGGAAREPRETHERGSRDRTVRGRRSSRETRITGHRTERRPDLPPASRSGAGNQGGGRPPRDENSPFSIRTSDRPILEVTSHDDATTAARASESKPPAPERRTEPPAGRQPRQGHEFNRGRGGRRPARSSAPDDSERSAAPERSEAATTPGRMSQTKVARELTRVSEHLRRIEAQTSRPTDDEFPPAEDATPVDSVEEPEMLTAAEVYARRAEETDAEPDPEPEPELDLDAEQEPEEEPPDEPEPEDEEEPEEEPELQLELQTSDDEDADVPETDEEEAPEWGRSRRHKGPRRRGEEPAAGDSDSGETAAVAPQESFSSEQVSFGRGKRKKPRA